MKCIYCHTNPASDDFSGIACGCSETPADMATAAPARPAKRRCSDCGEFAENCEGHHGAPRAETQFGYGGRIIAGGED